MRHILFSAMAVALLFTSTPARAQLVGTDTVPGSSCSGFPDGATRMTADADLDGAQVTLICDGTVWQTAGGGSLPACSQGDVLVYSSSSWVCSSTIGPNAFNFTDQTGVAYSTLTLSNVLQITGISGSLAISISGTGSPQFRICSNSSCTTEVLTWGSSPSTIQSNQYVQVRLTSAATGVSMLSATLTIGVGSNQWDVTTADCPNIGHVCSDGSIYAGLSPDGSIRMRVAAADEGGGATYCWNNCNNLNHVATGQTSLVTGEANTAAIVAIDSDSVTGGTQPHIAPQRCADSTAHGQTDWYLPALNELGVVYTNRIAIGGISGAAFWTSSETGATQATYITFANGNNFGMNKHSTNRVRCVRRE